MFYFIKNVVSLYAGGFRSMVLGRTLWSIILVKLVVLYALSRLYYPDYLQGRFPTDELRADHVIENLTAAAHSITDSGGSSD